MRRIVPLVLILAWSITAGPWLTWTQAVAQELTVPGPFAGRVAIGGGRELYLQCRGSGRPTVILEAGLRSRGDVWSVFAEPGMKQTVLGGVSRFTRVCEYDRPGTTLGADQRSRSTPVPMPRTARQVVGDLHALLRAARIPGPYVLVAHSTGGLFVRLFASTYPDTVVGMVLVDTVPDHLDKLLGPALWKIYDREILTKPPAPIANYRALEYIRFSASFAEIHRAPPLRPMPLVVLAHGRPFALPSGLPPGFGPVLERAWAAGQKQLARLVPHALYLVAARSSHYIQIEQPGLVMTAIHQVVQTVRCTPPVRSRCGKR